MGSCYPKEEENTTIHYTFHCGISGAQGVGKSSIVTRYTTGECSERTNEPNETTSYAYGYKENLEFGNKSITLII